MTIIRSSFLLLALIVAHAKAQQPPPPMNGAPNAPAKMEYAQPSPGKSVISPNGGPEITTGQQKQPKAGEGLPRDVFDSVISTTLPISPGQVKELHRIEDNVKKAHAARIGVMPSPVSRTTTQGFASGKSPEIIRLATDFSSSMVFTDATGAAWPVASIIIGNKDQLQIPELEGAVGGVLKEPINIFSLVPMQDYISTSISVRLVGAPAPLSFMVVSNQPYLDVRLDVSVLGRGPNAKQGTFESKSSNESMPAEFTSLLDGILPDGARALKTDSNVASATLIGDKLLVKTKLNILSPYVFKKGSSADGTSVYEVAKSSVLMLMDNGKVLTVNLSGFPPPSLAQIKKTN